MRTLQKLDPKEEHKIIEANGGKWPQPKCEELKQQSHLTEEQIGNLSENLIDHPAPSVVEKANIHRRYIATD